MEHICCAFSSTIKSHIAFDPRPHPFPSVPYSSLWLVSMVPVVSSASDTENQLSGLSTEMKMQEAQRYLPTTFTNVLQTNLQRCAPLQDSPGYSCLLLLLLMVMMMMDI